MPQASNRSMHAVAQVIPLLRVRSLGDRRFDYSIPEVLAGRVVVGSVVGVQFGQRRARAVVVGVSGRGVGAVSELKSIESVEDRFIPDDLLALAERLADRYIAPLESCLRLVAPPSPGRPRGRATPARDGAFLTEAAANAKREGRDMKLTAKQARLLGAIPESGMAARSACESAGVGRSVLRALADKGLVRLGPAPDRVGEAESDTDGADDADWRSLSREQTAAVDELNTLFEAPGLAHRQLWGVTGSGKTEVYLHLTRTALAHGAGVILLVPEIALTPLMIGRVEERFGEKVGVIHSGLTAAQKRRQYRRIAEGEARVVVGARSAVFAPVADLGLVIIDESHDGSYKQEEAPGYHARTVAQMRLEGSGGLLLEGSASPAVESMVDPSTRIRMEERTKGELPQCEVVDMRHRSTGGILAPVTREALAETVRRDEQAIVLLNRRGYSGHIHCESCGHVMMCDDCELSLTYHSRDKRLLCHHCGRSYRQPTLCPACEESPLARGGPGTERMCEELGKMVAAEKVFRLDSDASKSGSGVRRLLEEFSVSHPALLVGTQMVAKGHDFPDVTLVVVADADTGLFVPDFRAAERTFQLLTQVSGRAGRAERPGKVLVQTWNPDVPCIRMALDREDEAFYQREAAVRERLGYPPFTQLVRLLTTGKHPQRVQMAAQHLAESLGRHFEVRELWGPARLAGLRGRSRWHVVVSSRDGERARAVVAQAAAQLSGPYRDRGVNLSVDVDPYTFA